MIYLSEKNLIEMNFTLISQFSPSEEMMVKNNCIVWSIDQYNAVIFFVI